MLLFAGVCVCQSVLNLSFRVCSSFGVGRHASKLKDLLFAMLSPEQHQKVADRNASGETIHSFAKLLNWLQSRMETNAILMMEQHAYAEASKCLETMQMLAATLPQAEDRHKPAMYERRSNFARTTTHTHARNTHASRKGRECVHDVSPLTSVVVSCVLCLVVRVDRCCGIAVEDGSVLCSLLSYYHLVQATPSDQLDLLRDVAVQVKASMAGADEGEEQVKYSIGRHDEKVDSKVTTIPAHAHLRHAIKCPSRVRS